MTFECTAFELRYRPSYLIQGALQIVGPIELHVFAHGRGLELERPLMTGVEPTVDSGIGGATVRNRC